MNTTSTSLRSRSSQPNRRRHVRVPARGVAGHLQTMDASMPGLAIENLSPSGMFVRCAAALEVGTPVMIQLVRPGLKRAIPVQGCVVSVIAPTGARETSVVAGMGIRLDHVDGDAEQRLRQLVDELAAASSSAGAHAPSGSASDEVAARDQRIQGLEEEVQTLRRELLRRNRTIGDLATRLAALEAPPKRGAFGRADPRAD